MRIVIAPDKFKGCLEAPAVARAIEAGVRRAVPEAVIDLCPVADGGEGTVATLVAATNGTFQTRRVTGPLPEMKVDARFGLLGGGKIAVVEMAAASGLALLRPEDRNPLNTTTFGTGELLMEAVKLGVDQIILGIGGSATIDAGIGCAQACGLPVILEHGEPLSPTEPLCGRDLDRVVLVKHGRGSPIERVRITVACDVSNPLFGPNGAAPVYGPQKGASADEARSLDDSLRALAERTDNSSLAMVPGAGAAGGLGFAMLAFFHATLRSGVDLVLESLQMAQRLAGADLCITGEGRLDSQSLQGKAPFGVAQLCKAANVPCIALVGSLASGAESLLSDSFAAIHAIDNGSRPLEECIRDASRLLELSAADALEELLRSR